MESQYQCNTIIKKFLVKISQGILTAVADHSTGIMRVTPPRLNAYNYNISNASFIILIVSCIGMTCSRIFVGVDPYLQLYTPPGFIMIAFINRKIYNFLNAHAVTVLLFT